MLPPPPTSTLFPYTTLFRSLDFALLALDVDAAGGVDLLGPQDVAGLLRGLSARREGPRSRNGVPDLDRRRSEEHTSELQSRGHLVCRLLLEKKKQKNIHVMS